MRIIPVIDLKGGRVVRGVAGRRDEYRPIESLLCDDPSPVTVGGAFRRLGFNEAYVADLDSIAGAEPDWRAYEALIDCGLRLLVDAGIATVERAKSLARFTGGGKQATGIIVGLESITDVAELAAVAKLIASDRLIFSLDLRDGTPVTRVAQWARLSAEEIAAEVVTLGIRRLIVLDVARVGVGGGVGTFDLCRHLRQAHRRLEIISGGGVRNVDDLTELATAGCDAALVASALHNGRLLAADLRRVDTDIQPQ